MIPSKKDSIESQYRSFIENAYIPIPKDAQEKIIDNLLSLVELAGEKRQSLKAIFEQTCKIIFRLFGFREVAIGLKSREDFQFRYEELFGYRKDVADNFRKMKYSFEDMVSQERFPHIKIGKLAELNPMEGLPQWEKELYNRPYQLKEERAAPDEFHEGDYIDVFIYANNRDLVGWIELSSPVDGKLPSRITVRWIELIAGILGLVISEKWMDQDSERK